ncbi:MAG: hypothetical protein HYW07_01015 [Candidatus Latescibacteria bacterium]|nr:hypothetical protein [Candidatus Latescibacterota bacterium]
MKGTWILAGVLSLMPLALWAGEAMGAEQLRAGLERLHRQELWGELELAGGGTREVRVDSVAGDTVVVREILGALMERPAVYALSQIRSLRELGAQRIPLRRAAYASHRSLPLALGLEVLVPGGGYFYAGQARQGLVLLALAGAALGTALATLAGRSARRIAGDERRGGAPPAGRHGAWVAVELGFLKG